ncbi:hypothetical protein [Arcobacter sp.]|uniref:hypothetical protein n=1 Tax=Arcobacter sp. TaxID=1872629 RepID=UPI003D14377D
MINIMFFVVLPKQGIEHITETQYKFTLRNYDYLSVFGFKNLPSQKKELTVAKDNYPLLSQIELNAIYSKSNGLGWIVLKEKSGNKTHVLGLQDSFKNYKLKSVNKSFAIFEKDGMEYKLEMKKDKLKYKVVKDDK